MRESNLPPSRLCRGAVYKRFYFTTPPRILSFLVSGTEVNLDSTLTVSTDEGPNQYELKGVVYFFENHFTARVIRKDDMVWFYDGLETRLEYIG